MEGPQERSDAPTSPGGVTDAGALAPSGNALPGEPMPSEPPLDAPIPSKPMAGHIVQHRRDDHSTAVTPVSKRIGGLDMARALAIIGMVMVHFGPGNIDVDRPAGFLYETSHGRASILFIVLAGVGVSLLAGDRNPARIRGTTRKLLFRAAVLFPAGLALQALNPRIFVILHYYAVFFLVALATVRLRDRWLLTGSGLTLIAAPVIYLAVWFARPDWFVFRGHPALFPPEDLALALTLTGHYPALVWTAPLLFGMWLGRRDLRALTARLRLLAGGAATAAVGYLAAWLLTARVGAPPQGAPSWRWLAVAEPHSEMPLWLLSSMGVAAAVIGASLIVAARLPRASWPLVAAGQLALSIYVGHLLVLVWFPEWLVRSEVGSAFVSVARFSLVTILLATAWRAMASRGPLEWVLHLPFRRSAPTS